MIYLIENHKTKYVIYLGDNASMMIKNASLLLKKYLDMAFDIDVRITNKKTNKNIIIRESKLHGVSYIKEKDDLIIEGSDSYGPYDAVMEFLNKYINLEIYNSDAITFKRRANLSIKENYHYIPSIRYRIASYGWVRTNALLKRMTKTISNDELFITSNNFHNAFDILKYRNTVIKDEWLTKDKKQLCYSSNDMRSQFVSNLKDYLLDKEKCNLNNHFMVLGMEDNLSWCDCPLCQKVSPSFLMVDFVNYVEKEINENRKEPIIFLLFAYYNTLIAPSNINCNDNVGVIFAPIKMSFRNSFTNNFDYLVELKKWSKLTKHLFSWTYNFYTRRNFFTYDTFKSMKANYLSLVNNDISFLYDQTESYSMMQTGYSTLKSYLQHKLMWNVNLDINKLIDNFFDNYFLDASKEMKTLFNKTRKEYLRLYKNECIKLNHPSNENDLNVYSEIGQVIDKFNSIDEQFIDFIYQANKKLDDIINNFHFNENIKKRVLVESVQYRYWKLLIEKKKDPNVGFNQLVSLLNEVGITHYQEGKLIGENMN